MSKNEIELGWCTMNHRAVSPVIDEEILISFPYTDGYDEWYFFMLSQRIFLQ